VRTPGRKRRRDPSHLPRGERGDSGRQLLGAPYLEREGRGGHLFPSISERSHSGLCSRGKLLGKRGIPGRVGIESLTDLRKRLEEKTEGILLEEKRKKGKELMPHERV